MFITGILHSAIWNLSLNIETLNFALNCGSSKHGNAERAYVGSKWVVARYLRGRKKHTVTIFSRPPSAMLNAPSAMFSNKKIITVSEWPLFSFRGDVAAEIEPLEFARQLRDEPQVHRVVPPLAKFTLLQLQIQLLMLRIFQQLCDF